MMPIIYAISDSHSFLPKIPDDCQILLHGGDFCWEEDIHSCLKFINGPFYKWVKNLCDKGVVVVCTGGNHDEPLQYMRENVREFPKNFHWVIDELVEIDGLKIWGSPWSLNYNNWAFMAEEDELAEKYNKIPHIDILISHGPTYGILDEVRDDYEIIHVGSRALKEAIDRIKPSVCIFGHIHSGAGKIIEKDGTIYYGASYVDEDYKPCNPPMKISFPS